MQMSCFTINFSGRVGCVRVTCAVLCPVVFVACGSAPTTQSRASGGNPGLNLPPPALCPDSSAPASTPSVCVPGLHRDFSADIVPLFSGCGGEICHSFQAGGIAYEIGASASECCGELAVIDPGHPESSYLLNKLTGKGLCGGAQMPIGRAPFSATDIRTISDWICEGAPTKP
ncbi:MAG: hypothetical protein ABUL62_09445 [Myxococcales bacterium]